MTPLPPTHRLAAATLNFSQKGLAAVAPDIRGSTNAEEAGLRLERAIEFEHAIEKLIEASTTKESLSAKFDNEFDAKQVDWIRTVYSEALMEFDPIHRSIVHPTQGFVVANTQRVIRSPEALASLLEPFDLENLKPNRDWEPDLIPRYARAFFRFREYATLIAACKAEMFTELSQLFPNIAEAPMLFSRGLFSSYQLVLYVRVDPSAGEPLRVLSPGDPADIPELHPGYLRVNAPTFANAKAKVVATGFMVIPPFTAADYAALFRQLADGLTWLSKSPTLNHRPNPFLGVRMEKPYQMLTPFPNV